MDEFESVIMFDGVRYDPKNKRIVHNPPQSILDYEFHFSYYLVLTSSHHVPEYSFMR